METYCFIAAQYLPTMGGVENFTFNLARELARRGNRVIVVTSLKDKLCDTETDENNIEIIRVPSYQLLNARLPVVKPNAQTRAQFKRLAKIGITKMIINTRFYPLSLYSARFAKKHRIPCVVLEHGSAHLSLGTGFIDFAVKAYEHMACKMVYHYCKSFYGVSKKCVEWLLHFGIKGRGVIYNAIDLSAVSAEKNSLDLKKYNVCETDKIICYVGRLIPEKGVLQLLTAFKSAEEHMKGYTLIFAGEGPLLQEMQKNAAKNIIFTGKLSFNEIISLFKQAEIFCLPTVSEGFPSTVLEAAACGCFILTTVSSGGATELICSDEYGALMPDNSAETIKEALISTIAYGNLKQRAKSCQKRVQDNFTWQKTADSLAAVSWQRR